MTRIADPERPAELLEKILEYIVDHGLTGLSLRPLAKAIGSSPRVLLYYFGSKESLIAQVFAHLRGRQQAAIAHLNEQTYVHPTDACRAGWAMMSSPQFLPVYTLFFETYAYALRNRKQHEQFLRHAIEDWLRFIETPALAAGAPTKQARRYATIVLAGFRGFVMDLCATGDRERVDAAVSEWLETLQFHLPRKKRHAATA